ncbi:MAG: acyltransferase family protein [Erysipelotrichales bacterium]|nr:acyltransferase family protein [Erysipelotrichales bacterium]
MKTSLRNSTLDLLRLLSIFGVLILHYFNSNFGGVLGNPSVSNINMLFAHFIESLCIIAVNVFVIISGYFMVDQKSFKLRKVIDILLICLFYGIIIFILYLIINYFHGVEVVIDAYTVKTLIYSIIDRWFVVIYIILYILSPFINKLFNSLNKKDILKLLGIMILFFSIWPTLITNTTVKDDGYGIINFIILYLVGAYIKKYKNDYNKKISMCMIYICMTIITTIFSYYSPKAWSYNSIFNMISSISLFLFFKSIKIKNSRAISYFAQFSLGIYIIHENQFIVKYLYQDIFKTPMFYGSNLFLPHIIFTALGIFSLCLIIEIIRKFIFKYTIDRIIDKTKICNIQYSV